MWMVNVYVLFYFSEKYANFSFCIDMNWCAASHLTGR